jgi:hypothetical protein
MNYPEYLRRGWQIGSGSVESGCKKVLNKRLSMGGMPPAMPSAAFVNACASRATGLLRIHRQVLPDKRHFS